MDPRVTIERRAERQLQVDELPERPERSETVRASAFEAVPHAAV